MKFIFWIFLFVSLNSIGQNFKYSFIDPCTGTLKELMVPKEGVTVNYYKQIKTFQPDEMINGTFISWANSVVQNYGGGNPCGSIIGVASAIDIGQQTAINTINLINSISSIADFQNSLAQSIEGGSGSLNITSSLESAKSTEGKKDKKNDKNTQNSNNSNNNSIGSNGSQSPQNQGNNQENGQNSPILGDNSVNSNQNSGISQNDQTPQNQESTQNGYNSSSNGGNNAQTGINSQSQTNGTNSNNNNQVGQGTSQSNSSNNQQGGTSNSNSPTNSSTNVQGGNNSTSNQSVENGSSSSEQNINQGQVSGGQNDKEIPKTETNLQTSDNSKNSNVLGGVVTSIQRASGSKDGGKPSILLSSDLTGFNFQQGDVTYGGKGTMGYTSMRWDGLRTHGIMADYTSVQRGPNVTAFYAIINKKRIDLLSTTMTASFLGRGSLYGTFAAGQMWTLKKNAKIIYLLTGSFGQVYKEKFKGTAVVTGGMYDLSLGKRIDMKMMGLFIYAPFISYYNDIVLKSPYVVMPVLGTNIKITKNFKFNINFGGAYAINENVMNFTIMCGTRLAL
jgi:hypothetical protein